MKTAVRTSCKKLLSVNSRYAVLRLWQLIDKMKNIMISYIIKLFHALNENAKSSEIAHAFSLGLILGFMPKNNLLWYLLFVLFLFVRINKGGYFIMMILGALIAPLLDTLFDSVGYFVLTLKPLESFFATLLDIPFVGFTKFNNTIVMGSLACGIVCYVPYFFLMKLFIKYWRTSLAQAIRQSKVGKAINALPVISKIAKKASDLV